MHNFLLVVKHASQRTMANMSIGTGKNKNKNKTKSRIPESHCNKFSRLTQREHRTCLGCLRLVTAPMVYSVLERKNTMYQRLKLRSPKHKDTVLILRELSNRSLPFRTFCSLVLKWVGRLVSKPPWPSQSWTHQCNTDPSSSPQGWIPLPKLCWKR